MPDITRRRRCRCGHALEYSVSTPLPRRCPVCLTMYRHPEPGHQQALFDTALHTENETLRSRVTWLTQENQELTRRLEEAETRRREITADLTRARELLSLLGPLGGNVGRVNVSELERALTQVIGVVHPDKWQGASADALATEVTKQLLELRSRLKEGLSHA